jgi:hypothetical protein
MSLWSNDIIMISLVVLDPVTNPNLPYHWKATEKGGV